VGEGAGLEEVGVAAAEASAIGSRGAEVVGVGLGGAMSEGMVSPGRGKKRCMPSGSCAALMVLPKDLGVRM
jgi:hypothetical protein